MPPHLFLPPPSLPTYPTRLRPRRVQTATLLDVAPLGPLPNICPLSLGTWSWGNRLLYNYTPRDDEELQQTFNIAVTRGINLIDTADSYGTQAYNARAEKLLSRFLRESPVHPDSVKVATKFATYPWRISRHSIKFAAEMSATRLDRVVDLGQMHWSSLRYAPFQEKAILDGLVDAKAAGYIRHIGVSNVGPVHLRRIHAYLSDKHGVHLAAAQVQLSLLRQTSLNDGLFQTASDLHVGVLGYSPLCLGVLSDTTMQKSSSLSPIRRLLRNRLRAPALLSVLSGLAMKHQCTPAEIALHWALSTGATIISGARTPAQITSAIRASELQIPQHELQQLRDVAAQGPQMVENIFQTN